MALSLHVPLFLAIVVFGLAMTPMAYKFSPKIPRLMGEMEDADIDDEEVEYVLEFALEKYNENNQDPNLSRLAHVVRARQKIGLGMNYYLDVEIGRTTCDKSQSNEHDCPFSEDPKQLCSFVVNFRPWAYDIHLESSSCHEA